MRIVTYNVNSVNARLPNLLRWLEETTPEVVCLQELKSTQEKTTNPTMASSTTPTKHAATIAN